LSTLDDDIVKNFDEPIIQEIEEYTTVEIEQEVIVESIPYSSRLQKWVNKTRKSREEIQEMKFLDKHIKNENETLKSNIAILQRENKQLEV